MDFSKHYNLYCIKKLHTKKGENSFTQRKCIKYCKMLKILQNVNKLAKNS